MSIRSEGRWVLLSGVLTWKKLKNWNWTKEIEGGEDEWAGGGIGTFNSDEVGEFAELEEALFFGAESRRCC